MKKEPASYALARAPHIDLMRFACERESRHIGRSFWAFNRLPSTNTLLKTLPPGTAHAGLLCLGRHQYHGRGQGQRRWETEDRSALNVSVYLQPPARCSDRLQLLLQAAALSVVQTLKECYAINALLKWPNDVLAGGKKISGILAETSFVGSSIERFVLGIGINTNGGIPESLARERINIEDIIGRPANHTDLLLSLVKHLDQNYARWLQQDSRLVTDINTHHRGYGRQVVLQTTAGEQAGTMKFLGLDVHGYPVFLDEFDDIKRFKNNDIRFAPPG